ncbi:MAG: hypothetical protein ACIAXF_08910 [Phycisphaerales bacterium JB063]
MLHNLHRLSPTRRPQAKREAFLMLFSRMLDGDLCTDELAELEAILRSSRAARVQAVELLSLEQGLYQALAPQQTLEWLEPAGCT